MKQILFQVKSRLAATEPDDAYITVRMDNVSTHAALIEDDDIKNWGIKICLLDKHTGSKNRLAPLDGRIAVFSKFLTLELSKPGISKEIAVEEATKKFNFTIGAEGFRPTELFHGRYVHGEPFKVDIAALTKATIILRKCVQKSVEKKRFENTKLRPIKFVPFVENLSYNNRNKMPIKLGDVIMIDEGGFNKENYRPLYKIVETTGFLNGINWDTGLVACKKLDLKKENMGKIFIWEMNWIMHIMDGNVKTVNIIDINKKLDNQIVSEAKESYGCFDVSLYL